MMRISKICGHCVCLKEGHCRCQDEKSCVYCDMPRKVLLVDKYGEDEDD